jgi:hypothetical protein
MQPGVQTGRRIVSMKCTYVGETGPRETVSINASESLFQKWLEFPATDAIHFKGVI